MIKVIVFIVLLVYFAIRLLWGCTQRRTFNQYCKHIFDFKKHLSPLELKYVYAMIKYSNRKRLFIGNNEISFHSYSIHFSDEKINTSRLAYGTLYKNSCAENLVDQILEERGIQNDHILLKLSSMKKSRFYGLGWDIQNNHFKVYYIFEDFHYIPVDILEKTNYNKKLQHKNSGLIGITFQNNVLHDVKLYLYNDEHVNMLTKSRKAIQQYDTTTHNYKSEIKKSNIINKCKTLGLYFDTFTNDTLYFQDLSSSFFI